MTTRKQEEEIINFDNTKSTLANLVPLIESERSSGVGHYVVYRQYPSKDVEIVAIRKNPDDLLYGKGGARKNDTREEQDADTIRRSQARAKRQIKRTLLCMLPDRMLTLTYKENKTDLDECWKDITKFGRKMKKRYPHFAYVAVPEEQKRGAIHWHLAIRGYYHANTVRRIWKSIVGEGNIDITTPRNEKGKSIKNPKKIANYIAKYITKTSVALFNKRRYSRGGKITPPIVKTGWIAYGAPVLMLMEKLLKKTTHLQPRAPWESEEWNLIYLST